MLLQQFYAASTETLDLLTIISAPDYKLANAVRSAARPCRAHTIHLQQVTTIIVEMSVEIPLQLGFYAGSQGAW